MKNATYAGLRMAARAGKPKPDEMESDDNAEGEEEADEAEAGKKPKGKKKDEYMNESEANAAIAAARAEGFAEANARVSTVLASEHYAGREVLAGTMLANDKLSADEIVSMLAAAPKASTPETGGEEGGDDAARAEMRGRLAAEQPGNTENGGDHEPTPQANYGWEEIHAEVEANRGL